MSSTSGPLPTDVVASSTADIFNVNITCAVFDTVVDVPYGLHAVAVLETSTSGDALVVTFTMTLSCRPARTVAVPGW